MNRHLPTFIIVFISIFAVFSTSAKARTDADCPRAVSLHDDFPYVGVLLFEHGQVSKRLSCLYRQRSVINRELKPLYACLNKLRNARQMYFFHTDAALRAIIESSRLNDWIIKNKRNRRLVIRAKKQKVQLLSEFAHHKLKARYFDNTLPKIIRARAKISCSDSRFEKLVRIYEVRDHRYQNTFDRFVKLTEKISDKCTKEPGNEVLCHLTALSPLRTIARAPKWKFSPAVRETAKDAVATILTKKLSK